jgi:hypothetical protein
MFHPESHLIEDENQGITWCHSPFVTVTAFKNKNHNDRGKLSTQNLRQQKTHTPTVL